MKYQVRDVCRIMEELAPLELAFEWDNVGLQIGDPDQEVSGVLLTLSVTIESVQKAIAGGADLIIAHHPVIFKPLPHIRTDTPEGSLLTAILKHDLAVYVAHTNLDQAEQGLNQWLARDLGLREQRVLAPVDNGTVGLGRIGTVAPAKLRTFAQQIEDLWNCSVRLVGDPEQEIRTVAVLGGSGGDFVQKARESGADVLVTGDVSYHDAMDARSLGLAVLDAGHFATEQIVVKELGRYLAERWGDRIRILEDHGASPFASE